MKPFAKGLKITIYPKRNNEPEPEIELAVPPDSGYKEFYERIKASMGWEV